MFQVLLTYPNIFNIGVFLPTVNCAALKWWRIDQKLPQSDYSGVATIYSALRLDTVSYRLQK